MNGRDDIILRVEGLRKHFPVRRGLLRKTVRHIQAVEDVSFDVRRGETLGLVGESGCGKTTVGRCLLRLIEPTEGRILLNVNGDTIDLMTLSHGDLKAVRPLAQMVFQDPNSSLNPRMTVGDIVAEPLKVCGTNRGGNLGDRVGVLLESVGLKRQDMQRYPHAFSGGQRQRIGIARALALQPKLVIADEPVSALDVSVQAQILNLLADLRAEHGFSCLFIAHDLSVVEHICDRVAVMYLGRIVEIGDSDTLYRSPGHPYTEALLSAVPVADPREQRSRRRVSLSGDVPDASNPPPGCPFHTRCRYVTDVCRNKVPSLRDVAGGTQVACHLTKELDLQGV
jgi:peptide/nickel transport system ATP-binding protein